MIDPARLQDPGYTPSRSEIPEVIESLLTCDDDQAARIERVLGRAGEPAAEHAVAQLSNAAPPARVRLVRLIARVARESESSTLFDALCTELDDPEAIVQRAAVIGIGKLKHPGAENSLLAYAAREHALPELRVLIEALGKVGSSPAADWLKSQSSADAHTQRLIERAQLMLSRTASRPEQLDSLDLSVPLDTPHSLVFTCRQGLERILCDEVSAFGAPQVSPGRVCIAGYTGALNAALVSRTALGVGIELPLDRQHSLHQAVIHALRDARLFDWMTAVSHGTPRVRLEFLGQGHQRAATWDLQTLMIREELPLITDPTSAGWEIVVDTNNARLELMPKRFDDPRYPWRVKDVPAASHPTIAAALARVGGVRADDVIWDPFVGSGLELIERALLGAYRVMYGTDVDETALGAAKANIAAAQVKHVTLLNRDASSAPVRDITLVLTNPPMGARLVRDGSLGDLLEAVLAHGYCMMRPGARWVWLSPMPARMAAFAHHLGFDVERRGLVDLGGLSPELQIFHVPERQNNPRHGQPPAPTGVPRESGSAPAGKRRRVVR